MSKQCNENDSQLILHNGIDEGKFFFLQLLHLLPRNQWMRLPSARKLCDKITSLNQVKKITELTGLHEQFFLEVMKCFGTIETLDYFKDKKNVLR